MLSRAFGLSLDFDLDLPGAWREAPVRGPVLRLREADPEEIAARWSGREAVEWEATIDGAPFLAERGVAGDHRFAHGEGSVQLLSAGGELLRCAAPADPGSAARWRVVLDSVLFSVALLHGYEALHAGAVASEAGAVAILAGSGGGKSTLLAELLSRGAPLLADDVVVLGTGEGGIPLAHPGPPLMTLPDAVAVPPGEPIARVGEESWRAVPVAAAPLPLAAVVVLSRRPGADSALRPLAAPLALLLASLLRFPRSPERERARFELAAEIAAAVPIWELAADSALAPGALADLLPADLGLGRR